MMYMGISHDSHAPDDMTAQYLADDESKQILLALLPVNMEDRYDRKQGLSAMDRPCFILFSCVSLRASAGRYSPHPADSG